MDCFSFLKRLVLNSCFELIALMFRSKVRMVLDKKVNLKDFTLIEGFPGIGLVGTIAAGYIIEKRKMEPVGHLESEFFPPMAAIHEGRPYFPARLFKDREKDFCILLSEFIVPSNIVYDLSNTILNFAKKQGIMRIISLAGMSANGKIKNKVFGIGSNDETINYLKLKGVPLINEGITTGVSGLLLAKANSLDYPVISLLAKSSIEYPDPRASAELIKELGNLVGLEVSIDDLLKEAKTIENKFKGMIHNIQQMKNYKKAEEGELPMYN